MNQRNGSPKTPEMGGSLEDILRQHTAEQARSGIFAAWIELVDRYFGGKDPEGQAGLSAFARTELPLTASIRRNPDNRYPGVHSYFLVKLDPSTKSRITFGQYGLEPIIVANVDDGGNIVDMDANGTPRTYAEEQVKIVVRQAHELETLGITMESNSMRAQGFIEWQQEMLRPV